MAFLSKVGNILRQTATKQINHDLCPQPSFFQAMRWMSSSKVFVGGISYQTDEESLREAFAKYGDVIDARVIVDRETGRSKGFGFITYTSSEEASSAIQALDGQDLQGRRVRVDYATDKRSGFGGGGGYGGAGAGGGGGGGYGSGYGRGGNYGGSDGVGDGFGSGGNNSLNYGGDNYGSGGGNFGRSGAGGYGGSTYSTGGAGANDNFDSGGCERSMGSTFSGGSDQFSNTESFGTGNKFGDNNEADPLEGNYQDEDDDANDFVKRA